MDQIWSILPARALANACDDGLRKSISKGRRDYRNVAPLPPRDGVGEQSRSQRDTHARLKYAKALSLY
jgi:hypothetical protein